VAPSVDPQGDDAKGVAVESIRLNFTDAK
jgi:hypothetical protein